MEIVPFAGRPNNLRVVSGQLELIATLDVGPRVLRFGLVGGSNHLRVNPAHEGLIGGGEYRGYGGHRLWVAPEEIPKTTHPDNGAVAIAGSDDGYDLVAEPESWGIRKSIRIRKIQSGFEIMHRIENVSSGSIRLAPWAITVMAAGGECVVPTPEPVCHTERKLPVAPIALWGYTDLADPRYKIGSRAIRLLQRPGEPTKFGMFVAQGWAAYLNFGEAFLKTFPARDATYPDFGCNFEAFTRSDMLEVESLGPLVELSPGSASEHTERWTIARDLDPSLDDSALAERLGSIARQIG